MPFIISLPTSEESAQKEYQLYEFAKYQPEAYAEAYEKAGKPFPPGAAFHLKLSFMHDASRLSDTVRNLLKLEDGDAEGKAAFTAKSCLETLLHNLKNGTAEEILQMQSSLFDLESDIENRLFDEQQDEAEAA